VKAGDIRSPRRRSPRDSVSVEVVGREMVAEFGADYPAARVVGAQDQTRIFAR